MGTNVDFYKNNGLSLSEPPLKLLLGKNLLAKLKENIVKGDVKTASKTNPPSSFPINRNTLDMAEEEDKHGKQEEYPPLLWVFVPLRKQTEQMQVQAQEKLQPQHIMFF